MADKMPPARMGGQAWRARVAGKADGKAWREMRAPGASPPVLALLEANKNERGIEDWKKLGV